MKILTEDLIGPPLDWAVTVALGCAREGIAWRLPDGTLQVGTSPYSTSGSEVIDIMEREKISVVRCNDLYFPKGNENGDYYEPYFRAETTDGKRCFGPTVRIAVMRCFVAAHLGSEVEIPDALLEK